MKKLILLLLPLIAGSAGAGVGYILQPSLPNMAHETIEAKEGHESPKSKHDTGHGETDKSGEVEYVKLNNQFVVPVVNDKFVDALVVMSLSIEIESGGSEKIYSLEPKLRDAFLQVLFEHANIGGFQGQFTDTSNLQVLKNALSDVAHTILGDNVVRVLITDIARQDA